MGKFDLGELLASGTVPKLDTDRRDQIEYIDIDHIDDDPRNFYELTNLDELAANIELFGLQQPIRVRDGEDGHVIIVSGHRRRAAISKLVECGRDDLKQIPCIREHSAGSDALQELRLIYANSDTRKLSSAEISKQAERVEALLYRLKEEGYDFPGRMRDHVAEACQVSKTKLARLKMIRDNLTPKMKKAWERGKLNESAAYTFAQKPVEVQDKAISYLTSRSYGNDPKYWNTSNIEDATGYAAKLMKLSCKEGGGTCENYDSMLMRLARGNYWSVACRQGKCCSTCSELASCKQACPKLADKVKKLRADKKAQRTHDAEVRAEQDRPMVERITAYWKRFGEARSAAGVSVKSWHKAMDIYYGKEKADQEYEQHEAGKKIKRDTTLPYGYNFYYSDADRLCRAADRFGCSVDYLLCRTDDPKGIAAEETTNEAFDAEAHAAPVAVAWYPQSVTPEPGQDIIAVDCTGYAEDARYMASGALSGGGMRWDEVALWSPAPTEVTRKDKRDAPAEGWVPLQYLPGKERPTKVGQQAVALFRCDEKAPHMRRIVAWDGSRWCFSSSGATIDAECVGWFPLPKDEDGFDDGTS